ncbi:hypothetical protein BH11MYX2_BH11MYX2_24620 [soil metagenome]
MRKTIGSLLFVLLVGGCTATGSARYSASATAPRMVYIDDSVQVVEDYDEPVFYLSNMYWRFEGGVWYQSRTHTSGWIRVASPPPQIVRIDRPAIYVHYKGKARAEERHEANENRREDRQDAKDVRHEEKQEHREEKQDVKQEKREEKQDARQDKREEKQDAKQDKREEKQDKHDAKKDKK